MRDYAMVIRLLEEDLAFYHRGPNLTECENAQQGAALLLRQGLFKKLAPSGQTDECVQGAIEKFLAINAQLKFEPPNSKDDESMTYMLHLVRDQLVQLLDADADGKGCDFEFLADTLAAGPGSSRLANARNWYSKFWDSDHSVTSPYVLALFRAAIVRSETWSDAYKHWMQKYRPRFVSGNSLFTVPKNSEISRMCCTEPLLNMLFQKAVGSFIERRLERWDIKLSTQPDANRALAKRGSLSGLYGTLDLSSASDSIALSLCEWALPPALFKWLRLFRSPQIRLPTGKEVELTMVSTMGNGFTFPLETAMFASAVRAVYIAKGVIPVIGLRGANAAIFGDDMIVREDCYVTLQKLLRRLGFIVNDGKSFNQGAFRESCGHDYFDGINIRPIYVVSLETPQDVYSAFNRLSRWSAQHKINLRRTLHLLQSWARFLPIPFSDADDAGFKVTSRNAPPTRTREGWVSYKKLVPETTAEVVPRDAATALEAGYADFNPGGWELSFLGGYTQNRTMILIDPEDPYERGNLEPDYDLISRRPFQGEVLVRRYQTASIPWWDWFGVQDEHRFDRCSFPTWQGRVDSVFFQKERLPM